MRQFRLLFLLLVAPTATYANQHGITPVTRVVQLLKGFQSKLEDELKEHEKAYTKYKCFVENTVRKNKEEVDDDTSKKNDAEQYVNDIENGKVEFTTERVDLEKKVAETMASIEQMDTDRAAQAADAEKAADDCRMTTDALDEAIGILDTATTDMKDGVFLSKKTTNILESLKNVKKLEEAVRMGKQYLGVGDAIFLERILTGEVPEKDWKQMNKKSDWNKDYKERSTKIQQVLKDLKATTLSSCTDADNAENKAIEDHNTLRGEKSATLEETKSSLADLQGESGAKMKTVGELNEEITKLQELIDANNAESETLKTELRERTTSYTNVKQLRIGELEAVAKAIHFLYNDDAREAHREGFKSQGYSFVQIHEHSNKLAASIQSLEVAYSRTNDSRMKIAANLLKNKYSLSGSAFTQVLSDIDSMIAELETTQQEDETGKNDCENQRKETTGDIVKNAREMDANEEHNVELRANIQKALLENEEFKDEHDQISIAISKANELRTEEHMEYLKQQAFDMASLQSIKDASNVLKDYYGRADGEEYQGGKEGSMGIVAILEMIGADVEKDMEKAELDENAAEDKHAEFVLKSEARQTALTDLIDENDFKINDSRDGWLYKITQNKDHSDFLHEQIKMLRESLTSMTKGCDFITVNFQLRKKHREVEIESLRNAHNIISEINKEQEAAKHEIQEQHDTKRLADTEKKSVTDAAERADDKANKAVEDAYSADGK